MSSMIHTDSHKTKANHIVFQKTLSVNIYMYIFSHNNNVNSSYSKSKRWDHKQLILQEF